MLDRVYAHFGEQGREMGEQGGDDVRALTADCVAVDDAFAENGIEVFGAFGRGG